VGNSRLGRVKIPTCIACDRPLLQKVQLDSITAGSGSIALSPTKGGAYLENSEYEDPASQTIQSAYNGTGGGGENTTFPAVFPDRPKTSQKIHIVKSNEVSKEMRRMNRPTSQQGMQGSNSLPNMF
jgi:hypothetical protein